MRDATDMTLSADGWTPPVQTFRVGDRVRVRANLECTYCFDPRYKVCYERALADDGRTGTVYSVGHNAGASCCMYEDEPDPAHIAHHVWVKWDERRSHDEPEARVGDWVIPFDAHFAPSELEPLS